MVDNGLAIRAGLVGQGISQSLTPVMHEVEGRAMGLEYFYHLIDTETRTYSGLSLSDIVEQAQRDGLVGLNVTHPYKIEIVDLLDGLSEEARKLGAVNTVVFRGGKKFGYNTDFSGFATSFRLTMDGMPKDRVLLLGAGGAGAAVGFALLDLGVRELLVYDTDCASAQNLVRKLQTHHPSTSILNPESLAHAVSLGLSGIVNATPMGMVNYPGSAFPLELLSQRYWVADVVYFPLETELLAKAKALGCQLMSGAGMAVGQAVCAFELFTRQSANPERMALTFNRAAAVLR